MLDDCENFVHSTSHNETFWCGKCVHILILGQMTMISSTSSLIFKFCHVHPFYVVNCNGQIYYVVHKLQFMSRMAIHLGVHNHLIMDGECQKFVEETKRLIIEEVDSTPNAKIFSISLSASKTFLASYLLDDSSDGIVELFKGEQLEHIQDNFCEFTSPNIYNLFFFQVSFKKWLYR